MIKKEFIGVSIFKKGFGTFVITEGNEALYKLIGLDIFEKNDRIKKGRAKGGITNVKGKDNVK